MRVLSILKNSVLACNGCIFVVSLLNWYWLNGWVSFVYFASMRIVWKTLSRNVVFQQALSLVESLWCIEMDLSNKSWEKSFLYIRVVTVSVDACKLLFYWSNCHLKVLSSLKRQTYSYFHFLTITILISK